MASSTTAQPGAGLRRWGKILSILGGVILLLSLIVGVILAVTGLGGAVESAEEAVRFTDTTSITLEADEAVQLYRPVGETPPACAAAPADSVGPGPSLTSAITVDGVKWESFDGFTATADGQYEITCDGTTEVLVTPPVSIGGIFAGIGGVLLGIFGGGLGLLLLILGLILFFVGRSQATTASAA